MTWGSDIVLYVMKQKHLTLRRRFDIADEHGRLCFTARGSFNAGLTWEFRLENPMGNEMAVVRIGRDAFAYKLFCLPRLDRQACEVYRGGRLAATVKGTSANPVSLAALFDVLLPNSESLQIRVSHWMHKFQIERRGQAVAQARAPWFRLHRTYHIDIASEEDPVLIIACVLGMQMVIDLAVHRHRH